ncbi:hypothetical protein [Mucilaginibacter sp. L3T2-6]|uniref:hypothetical protein n=1 Tax=Mucilaginibacter sp. L3T2-6 TaxID=3062491 RepID=UPI002675C075|nr:hypothetical protein [Mucilaginibacter sp. L3T2-6]MDO3645228.1 hypothetical protein [Mucilaginibacter sp. L3T2-6]MDV6217680.1 hypothetical protein [Mucilaginibacter sp. L3T2-6]
MQAEVKIPYFIQYKNGAVKLLTTDSQFPSTINSIGIQKSESLIFTRNLLIGSDKGLFQYDIDAEKPAQLYYEGAAKIYEATYRNEMYKDSLSEHGTGDTVTFHPVTFVLESVHALGFLWTGGQSFGNNIYTATCIPASLYQFGQLITYSSAVWGTEKGLFELNADASFNSDFQHRHYLPGIKVNKVTTMYGLVALGNAYIGGDATIIKNNLLAGTDKGLYYTSNFYEKGADGMHALNFFFFNQLGTLSINDLCVNTSATTRPICDNGVWLATVDGVYLLTPDYSRYIGNTRVAAVYFKGLSQNISETTICTGSSVTATVNTQKYSTAIIEWYQDNQQIFGQSGPELQITRSGDYHAVLHDPCSGIHIESEPVKVTVTPGPVFSFHYPDKLEFCDRQSARLETTNNDLYNYRWYKNGELIDGENTSSINLMEGGAYKVEVSA